MDKKMGIAQILEERKRHSEEECKLRLRKMRREIPGFAELETQINRLGAELLTAALELRKPEDLIRQMKDLQAKRRRLLEENGYSERDLKPIPYCEKCNDEGFVNGKSCSCREKLKVDLLYQNSELEDILKRQNFSTFNWKLFRTGTQSGEYLSPRENMENVVHYLKEYWLPGGPGVKKNIYLQGGVGTGKTFLLHCIAKELLDHKHSVLYRTAIGLVEEMVSYSFATFNEKERLQEGYDLLFQVDTLLIDDLGTEYKNEKTREVLFHILNRRLLNDKRTVITSNLGYYDLKDEYDERIYSRISGEYEVLVLSGNDLRQGE